MKKLRTAATPGFVSGSAGVLALWTADGVKVGDGDGAGPLLRQPELVEDGRQLRHPLRVARRVGVQHVGELVFFARAVAVVEERPGVAKGDLRVVLERLLVERV